MIRNDLFSGLRRAPQGYQDILSHYGQTLHGENIYRLIWGSARRYLVGGWWEKEREFGYKWMPKYGICEKWVLEKLLPVSTYGSPELWDKKTLSPEGYYQVGPFPLYGEYECVAVFSTGPGPGGYVPLEPGTVDLQARVIHMGRGRSVWDIRSNLRADEEAKQKHQDAAFDELWESLQHTRTGLTIGATGHYNNEDAINAYKQQLLARQDTWLRPEEFQGGFNQNDDLADLYEE